MWDHLTTDETRVRMAALEKYATAGIPDAAAAVGTYLTLNGERDGAIDWWSRLVEPAEDGTPNHYFFPYGRTIQTHGNRYGGTFGGPASHPRTPAVELEGFAAAPDPETRMEVATNPAAPEALLRLLATDSDTAVREQLVSNPACPPDLLAALKWSRAAEEDGETPAATWGAIARNPRCPIEVLQAYVEFEDEFDDDYEFDEVNLVISYSDYFLDVLSGVAENYGLSGDMITRLAAHHQPLVRQAIASNPVTPISVVQGLASDRDPGVRMHAAMNLGLSANDYSTLSIDSDPRVRAAIAFNPSAPEEVRATAALQAE